MTSRDEKLNHFNVDSGQDMSQYLKNDLSHTCKNQNWPCNHYNVDVVPFASALFMESDL